MFLIFFADPNEILLAKDRRESGRTASAHVDASFSWNPQG